MREEGKTSQTKVSITKGERTSASRMGSPQALNSTFYLNSWGWKDQMIATLTVYTVSGIL